MSELLLEVSGLFKSYTSGSRALEVLQGLDLSVGAGEAVAIVGDSGVGKSTLLHLLGGLDRPDRGSVRFRGAELYGAEPADLALYRNRQVGLVFQFHHLLPEFTALENVEMPFLIGRRGDEAAAAARPMLERLGLGGRLHHHPAELSGGEQQRVAIARAIAPGPSLLLADEPTGNLDPGTGAAVFALLRGLQAELGFALVLATHSERLARGCDRRLRLQDGRLQPLDAASMKEYFDGAIR